MIVETLEFWGFTPRDGVYLVIFVFGLGMLYQRLKAMEKKIDSFVIKEVLAEKEKAADGEHHAIRHEIHEVRERVATLEGRAMVR